MRLNPHDPHAFFWLTILAFAHLLRDEFQEAAQRATDALAKRVEFFLGHCALACSLAELDRSDEAREALAEMKRTMPAGRGGLTDWLARFADQAGRERVLQALRKAGWQG